ncbi:lipoate--protein ligase family protein [Virgibacillus alimentarius]|uniref:Octanoyl-[GcvH]:protein N-octanoyltransferase n=1 Tax=Virgibacillus alimentarius TaxID=698769 RepID=A0ABS4SC54_9BACI|nr:MULTISPECIES: lipoate--protein ligase family protein [Virgibacillus]MBP2257977.1 octanoyl-[GcvH]:protein N-octanoyltransferase/lipoyl amidotransferase [Virgibacillus alimentarius]HLR67276.1 lipoate--protein ligase family protein [Virgibacillus sp.]
MKNWKEIIQHGTFRYFDHSGNIDFHNKPYTALTSFAIDDALAHSVSDQLSPPVMRLWVHPNTVVLGIPDARLPQIEEGVKQLTAEGFRVIIRNSGGLAVALDEGVLNISLVLPGVKHISIHDCYEAMVSFVQHMLRDLTDKIQAYEIVGSYCPGDYDLSIDGKKFAGISQRRIKDGASIQIYLDVEGDSFERAALIKRFYDKSNISQASRFAYPEIKPEVMASLSTLLNQPLTVEDMKKRALGTLKELCDTIVESNFTNAEYVTFQKRYDQMIKRNEKIACLQ